MQKPVDLLSPVANELSRRRDIGEVGKATGISYDTLRRIRMRKDVKTSYSKVRALYEYLFGVKLKTEKPVKVEG